MEKNFETDGKEGGKKRLGWNAMDELYCACEVLKNSGLEPINTDGKNVEDEDEECTADISPLRLSRLRRMRKDEEKRRELSATFPETLERLSAYFGTTEMQTTILCAYISNYFEDDSNGSTFEEISQFFSCQTMKLLTHKDDIDALIEKKLLVENKSIVRRRRRRVFLRGSKTFTVADNVIDAILANEEIQFDQRKDDEAESEIDSVEFTTQVADITASRIDEGESTTVMRSKLKALEEDYSDSSFVQDALTLLPDFDDRMMLYVVCGDSMESDKGTSLNLTVRDLYEPSRKFKIARKYLDEDTPLFKKGLIEFSKKGNMSDATIVPTEKALKLLLGEDAVLFEKKMTGIELVEPKKIKAKKLFYSEENEKDISRLRRALSKKTFKMIQKRLAEQNLPSGVAILLYGAAGTGKTESVRQIAKATGREIYHVDISNTKSCWFGESEKIVKKIFKNYRSMCESHRHNGKPAPILLFNEADAVFSERKNPKSSNVAQTENAIQNIILEELETLDGILVATTNMADNLDSAFERRFLFKIKFDRPDENAKKNIWMSKLGWLDEETCLSFARKFDLSGGEIDNICRKISMEEVITGARPTTAQIEEFCRREKLSLAEGGNRMGFSL